MNKLERAIKIVHIKNEIEVNFQDRKFKDGDVGFIYGYLTALLGYHIIDFETYIKLEKELIEEYD